MAESDKARSTNLGVTLVEVMVAMVIFSAVFGLATNLVNKGVQAPFISSPAETWLHLIDETNSVIRNLSGKSSTWNLEAHQPPFSQMTLPKDLKSWRIELKPSNPELVMIEFTALTHNRKMIQWRFYQQEIK